MEKRLFIALPLPKEALKALAKYRDEMGRETPYLRWTPLQNLHVTALFLGDVAEEDIPLVREAVKKVCRNTKPFSLVCGGACYAPPHRPANMVWLSFKESTPFFTLAKKLAGALAAFAPAMDSKSWKAETPHVTLARFQRKVLPRKLRRLRFTSLEDGEVSISVCTLMESIHTSAGPLYRVMRAYPLTF